ncbi:MAG: hypothetical protein Q8M95_10500 [Candidatus Methanoperedens sp.]|nr:hypothetical protein [Candidatus Methanoperedens sp.]
MVDRQEHLKISDLLYDKARELNLQEDIISRMLSSECLLVSFDHIIFKKDTNQLGKNISPTRS